jgi:hypothetical protein
MHIATVWVSSPANGGERRLGRKPGTKVLIPLGYLHPAGEKKALMKSKVRQ